MASRKRRITIDGRTIHTDSDSSIADALRDAGVENPPSRVITDGEIITPDQYNRPAPLHDMLTIQTDLVKGATLRDRLLDRELELITHFLSDFPTRKRAIELHDPYLVIRAFPLPDSYQTDSIDSVDLLMVVSSYYDLPPAGIHIPSNTPNRDQIVKHLGGHVSTGNPQLLLKQLPESSRKYVEQLPAAGWDWICLHTSNWTWKFNPFNLLEGDCLFKIVEYVFLSLSGKHR
ncbi:MAG: hypothetical protein ACRD98_07050 [Nitrososphaera sp.]